MREIIISVMIGLVLIFGSVSCNTTSTSAAAGAVGLASAARILEDLGDTTEREKAIILADRLALEEESKTAEGERKSELEKLIEENKKLSGAVGVLNETVDTGQAALKTDWTDPEEISPWILAALGLGGSLIFGKKKMGLEQMLRAYNNSVTDYMAEANAEEGVKLRDKINGIK